VVMSHACYVSHKGVLLIYAVIDRFEGEYAVCEKDNREMTNIDRSRIPAEAREGDVLKLGNEIKIDQEETARRKTEMEEITRKLWG